MSKYDYEMKLKIVRENEQGYGRKYLSDKYGLKESTIENWIHLYKMYGKEALNKSMSKTNYTGEFKLSALQYRQNHKLSYKETAEHFSIKIHLPLLIGIENMKKADLNLYAVW